MQSLDDQCFQEALKGVPIPSSPAVLTELTTELRKPAPDRQHVARIIGKDVGLAATLLKFANSPLFGGSGEISSVSDGIELIGFGTLSNLIYESLLRRNIATPANSLERFWDNSAHTASVNADLAGILGGTPPATAYTFGLFHDCGIPLLVRRFPDYKDLLRRANESDRNFTAVEDDAINTNHAVIGYLLARSWKLPQTVATGILCHHDYDVLRDDRGLPEESRALIAINALADHITGQYLRLNQDKEWLKASRKVAAYFGRTDQEISDLADDMLYRLDKKA